MLPCDCCRYAGHLPATGYVVCRVDWEDIRRIGRQPESALNLKTKGHLYHFPHNYDLTYDPDTCIAFAEK